MSDDNTVIKQTIGRDLQWSLSLADIINESVEIQQDLQALVVAGETAKFSSLTILHDLEQIEKSNPKFQLNALPRVGSERQPGQNSSDYDRYETMRDGRTVKASKLDDVVMALDIGQQVQELIDNLKHFKSTGDKSRPLPTGWEYPTTDINQTIEQDITRANDQRKNLCAGFRNAIRFHQTRTKFKAMLPKITLTIREDGKGGYAKSTVPVIIFDASDPGTFKKMTASAFSGLSARELDDKNKPTGPDKIDEIVAKGGTYTALTEVLKRVTPDTPQVAVSKDAAATAFVADSPERMLKGMNGMLAGYYDSENKLNEKAYKELVEVLRKPAEVEGRKSLTELFDLLDKLNTDLARQIANDLERTKKVA